MDIGALSKDAKENDVLNKILPNFCNEYLQTNQQEEFLELDLIKRFVFILNQSKENSYGTKYSNRLACIGAIQFLLGFLGERINKLQASEAVSQLLQVITLIDCKFFDAERYNNLEKLADVSEYALIVRSCSKLIQKCSLNADIRDAQEFAVIRFKIIEKFIKSYQLQCNVLSEKTFASKDLMQEVLRVKARYLLLELTSLLSTDRKDAAVLFSSWINADQLLMKMDKFFSQQKKGALISLADAEITLEILMFLLHTHRICLNLAKERILNQDNLKRTLLYTLEVSRTKPSAFYQIINCLVNTSEDITAIQKVCNEISFTEFFIQNIGFSESMFDEIAVSCTYELYKPPKDIPTLSQPTWQINLTSIKQQNKFQDMDRYTIPIQNGLAQSA